MTRANFTRLLKFSNCFHKRRPFRVQRVKCIRLFRTAFLVPNFDDSLLPRSKCKQNTLSWDMDPFVGLVAFEHQTSSILVQRTLASHTEHLTWEVFEVTAGRISRRELTPPRHAVTGD